MLPGLRTGSPVGNAVTKVAVVAFIAFGLFLVACAFTHFIQIVTLWQPAFWFSGVAKAGGLVEVVF
mgnify:CR=1 FL=1